MRYLAAKVEESDGAAFRLLVLEDLPDAIQGATMVIMIVLVHHNLILVFQGAL